MYNYKMKYRRVVNGVLKDQQVQYCINTDIDANEFIDLINDIEDNKVNGKKLELISVRRFKDEKELRNNNIDGHFLMCISNN